MDLPAIVSYLPRELGARIEDSRIVINVKGELISKLKIKRRYRKYSVELRIGFIKSELLRQYTMLDIFAKGKHPHVSTLTNTLCIDLRNIPMFLRSEKEAAATIIKIISLLPHYNPLNNYIQVEQ